MTFDMPTLANMVWLLSTIVLTFLIGERYGKQTISFTAAWETIIKKSHPLWLGHIYKAEKQKLNVLSTREVVEQISDKIDQWPLIGIESTMGGPFQTIDSIEYEEETGVIVIHVSPSYCDW